MSSTSKAAVFGMPIGFVLGFLFVELLGVHQTSMLLAVIILIGGTLIGFFAVRQGVENAERQERQDRANRKILDE